MLGRLTRPGELPERLPRWLGKTQAEIDAKINATWNQLFYGDPSTQAIYFPVGTDQAEIRDTFPTTTSAPKASATR